MKKSFITSGPVLMMFEVFKRNGNRHTWVTEDVEMTALTIKIFDYEEGPSVETEP